MKRAIFCLTAVLLATTLPAGNSTLTYTAGQSTQIQSRLIPLYNRAHCNKFGLPAACTTAQLVSAGCAVQTFKTFTIDSCTIFTQDATGELNFLQEQANRHVAEVVSQLTASDSSDFCTNFKAASAGNQSTICTTLGLVSGCTPCP